MNRKSTLVLVALLLLGGCAGTRMPKLARCAGPYRYANPYETVLPTLPIPGQTDAPHEAATPATPPASPSLPTPPAPSSDPVPPAKTGGLAPRYPSC